MGGRDAGEATVRIGTVLLGVALAVAVLRALRRRHAAWVREGRYEDREARRRIVVDQDVIRVYWLCREPARLAAALDSSVRAETVDSTWSRWTVPTPDGVSRLLSVEVVGDIPELLLAWRAGNGWLPHEGTIRLAAAGTGRTEVSVTVRYRWSPEWAAAAGVTGDPVEGYLAHALERIAGAASAAASG
jgi:uncharacterized membrane protein